MLLKLLAVVSALADDLFVPADQTRVPVRSAVAAATAPPEYLGPTIRRRHARVDSGLLEQARAAAARGDEPARRVDLNLFDDASYGVSGLRIAPTSSGYSLSGVLDGHPLSSMTVVVNGEVIAGEVRVRGATYTIQSAGDVVEIRETEEGALPDCAGAETPPDAGAAVAAARDFPIADVQHAAAASEIDILVVYTSRALRAAGGEAAMEARIDLWVAAANTYFAASGIELRIRLVHAEELDHPETSSSFELSLLRQSGDGFMDSVHAMRDAVGADLVHLIEYFGRNGTVAYCGFAYLMENVGAAFAEYAFGTTVLGCGSVVFAHELGHNLGLNHDRYAEDIDPTEGLTNLPYGHAYGYVNQPAFASGAASSGRWLTIMAYGTQCSHSGFGCSRVARFSNPALNFRGAPIGVWRNGDTDAVTGPADAASTLNETRATVASFRSPGAAPGVVALKRRAPAEEVTNADRLRWRLAFSRGVKNVTADDFELSGSGLGTTTLAVTAKSGSKRIYDIQVTAGIASFDGEVTLGFASGQNIQGLSDVALGASWPAHAERTWTLDNTAPTPSISPSSAGSSPFVATVSFTEDVTGFADNSDLTATSATKTAPSRSDARTYTVKVTPTISVAGTIRLGVPASAARDLAGNASVAASQDVAWDPSTAASLSVSGLSDGSAAENSEWTSATPSTGGTPSGTVSWTKEGADADRFTIDSATGVLGLPGQDFEAPADANSDNEYEVAARATDAKGNTATAGVDVTVTDDAESKSVWVSFASSKKIPDGSGYSSSPFLNCDASCRAAGGAIEPVTWTKTGADAALFTLNPGSSWPTLSLGTRDFETPADANGDNDYEVTVQGTDADGNTASKNVTVRVIKGPPRWLRVSGVSSGAVAQNNDWTSATPSASGFSGDVTWTVEGPDSAQFRVDSSGVLTLSAQDHSKPVDADVDNVYEVRLRATDEKGNSGTAAVSVTVTDGVTRSPPTPPPPSPPPPSPPTPTPPGGGPSPPPPPPEPQGPGERPRAAITVHAECAALLCRARAGSPVSFEDTSAGTVSWRRWEFGDGKTSRSGTPVHSWSAPGFYEVTLTVSNGTDESTTSRTFLVEAGEPAGTCVADAQTRCLLDSRYAVTVDWLRADGEGGRGLVVHEGTNESGLFHFFDPNNWEVLIKLLDGCATNGHIWVYGASTTDLGHVIRVTDTVTGASKEYGNEPGSPADAVTDTKAFAAGCPR